MTYNRICEWTYKTPLEIYYIYLDIKEVYCIFETCCIITVLFSTKCRSFRNLIFFCPNNNHVFHKHSQKFKYQPGCLKVKDLTVNRINRIGLRDFTVPVRVSKLFFSIWTCQADTCLLVKAKALCWLVSDDAVAVKINKYLFFSCCPLTLSRMVKTLKESRVSWKRIS